MWNGNNPVQYGDPSGYCSDPGGSGVRVCADFFIMESAVLGLKGDNRDFSATERSDTFRVQINLDFANHPNSSIHVSDSHWQWGAEAGPGKAYKATITWDGDTARISVQAACGAFFCNKGATVAADFTATLNKDGSVSIKGARTQFPSFEAYSYTDGGFSTIEQDREDPKNWFGPGALMNGEDRLINAKSNPADVTDAISNMDPQ
jgi:hypothetical protein